ncbi:acetyl-CoA C-acetyltransferase [uncultured bacterium]|nr:acetyl-CoA C-acetyltransferase [uncultured bacterium]
MKRVFIVDALRTPTGKLLGALSTLAAPALGGAVIKAVLKKSVPDITAVDEVIMGNVLAAGVGQNPARQAALASGLPDTINAFTVNKVCASGMKAVSLGAQAIMTGAADVVIAGGMESMSNAPYLLRDMRRGKKYGDSALVDSMIYDGLMDCYYGEHMGALCESTVEKYAISRLEQDAFALESHRKAALAAKEGLFRDELIAIEAGGRTVTEDESIRKDASIEALSRLKPVFKKDGTVTAGNSPGLNDGGAAVLLASEEGLERLGRKPMAEIIGFSSSHTDPKWFTTAPVGSVRKLLASTGLKIESFDLIEENEAFAAQTLAVIKELSLDPLKVNVNGGAVSLGHPIGASGARIIVTLVHALKKRKKVLGLATICLGGGGAMSMAIKAVDEKE